MRYATRYIGFLLIGMVVPSILFTGMACGGQDDSLYQEFLVQRMMIAKLRASRGDAAGATLLESLRKEAKEIGMKLPEWAVPQPSVAASPGPEARGKSVPYEPLIQEASRTYKIPPALIKAVIRAESAFVHDAVSSKGAQGLMQLMPGTAQDIGVENAFDPRANILGGAMLLRKYLDEFRSLKKTLIAYNAGPEWVRKKRGMPGETRRYIRNVIDFYQSY